MKRITLFLVSIFSLTASFGQLNVKANEIAQQISTDTIKNINNPEEYVRIETIAGKLDFNKVLENEKSSLFLYDGVAYNKKDFAILLWGKKVKLLGISSGKKAIQLWEEINRRELTKSEKKALGRGFENKQ